MKKSGLKGMHAVANRKLRGRTTVSRRGFGSPHLTKPSVPIIAEREATRPVTAGGGKHRGDRRDMSRTYTGNVRHAARGSNPRPDVKTRKR